jgi:hypothetical protein
VRTCFEVVESVEYASGIDSLEDDAFLVGTFCHRRVHGKFQHHGAGRDSGFGEDIARVEEAVPSARAVEDVHRNACVEVWPLSVLLRRLAPEEAAPHVGTGPAAGQGGVAEPRDILVMRPKVGVVVRRPAAWLDLRLVDIYRATGGARHLG